MVSRSIKIIVFYFLSGYSSVAQDMTAYDLYKSCKNYYEWISTDFTTPVDDKIIFEMGKCQGIIETAGKNMLTLCIERKRNLNINRKLTANLKNIKSITIIKNFVEHGDNDPSLRRYKGHLYLMNFLSNKWPC